MRRKALDSIDEWYLSDRRSALMLRGARQVGKTYVVKDYCSQKGIHVLSIDLSEDERSRAVFKGDLTVDALILKLSAVHMDFEFIPGKTLIFLDEIQDCPDARTALKSFAEDGRYRVIASGSLLGLNMAKVRLPPTGYVETIDVGPLDFEEFLWALGVPEGPIQAVRRSLSDHEPIDGSIFLTMSEYYRWYLIVGGMPEAVLCFRDLRQYGPVRRMQEKIVERYKEDIREHAGDDALRSMVEACFDAVPKMLANDNKRFVFNDVAGQDLGKHYYDGHSHYAVALDWLAMARTTLRCRRVSEIETPLVAQVRGNLFKLYLLDTGLLMSLYGPELVPEVVNGDLGAASGAIAENAVAQAFAAQDRDLYFYRDPKGRTHADFVTYVDGDVCAVAIRTGRNRTSPSIGKLQAAGARGIVFETRNCFTDNKGVRHYPLFVASFMDSIDHFELPVPDFSSVDRLKAEYGGS